MNRREFLKKIGYTAAAGASGVALAQLPDTPQPGPTVAELRSAEQKAHRLMWADLPVTTCAIPFDVTRRRSL